MRGRVLGIAAGIAFSALVAGGAIAATCDDGTDKAAFHVRALQTELMVAALTCDARTDYNEFARKFQTSLIDQGQALKRQFRVVYGNASEKALNAYVTALANRASQRSIQGRNGFCKRAERTFAALRTMPAKRLADFSMKRPAGDVDVPSSCRPTMAVVDQSNVMNVAGKSQ